MLDDNFRKSGRRKFIFAHAVYLHGIRVKLRVKVKVTGAKKVEFLFTVPFPQSKTSIGSNSSSIKHRTMNFACSMGFSTMAGRMV